MDIELIDRIFELGRTYERTHLNVSSHSQGAAQQAIFEYCQIRADHVDRPQPTLSQPESNCPQSAFDPYDTIEQQDFI
jgi:hypothetical protein